MLNYPISGCGMQKWIMILPYSRYSNFIELNENDMKQALEYAEQILDAVSAILRGSAQDHTISGSQ
jgi:hypothetical protein